MPHLRNMTVFKASLSKLDDSRWSGFADRSMLTADLYAKFPPSCRIQEGNIVLCLSRIVKKTNSLSTTYSTMSCSVDPITNAPLVKKKESQEKPGGARRKEKTTTHPKGCSELKTNRSAVITGRLQIKPHFFLLI